MTGSKVRFLPHPQFRCWISDIGVHAGLSYSGSIRHSHCRDGGPIPPRSTILKIKFKTGIKISFIGTAFETVGIALDIFHHLDIGIETAEGLLTFNHELIFLGFLINFIGILMTWFANENQESNVL